MHELNKLGSAVTIPTDVNVRQRRIVSLHYRVENWYPLGTHTHCTGNCYSLIGRAGAANPNPLTWELGDGEPLAEHVAEVVAVPGEEVVGVSRPLAAELPQDPVHGGDGALGLPEDDALAVGVHGVLPDGAAEDAAAVLAEPERPLLLAIDLRTSGIRTKKGEREPTKISEIWRRKEGEGEAKANAPLTRGDLGGRAEANLDGAVEDAAEADPVLEDAVDLEDGVVRLLRVAVRHVVHVEHHLLHLINGAARPLPAAGCSLPPPPSPAAAARGDWVAGGGRRASGWWLVGCLQVVVVVTSLVGLGRMHLSAKGLGGTFGGRVTDKWGPGRQLRRFNWVSLLSSRNLSSNRPRRTRCTVSLCISRTTEVEGLSRKNLTNKALYFLHPKKILCSSGLDKIKIDQFSAINLKLVLLGQ